MKYECDLCGKAFDDTEVEQFNCEVCGCTACEECWKANLHENQKITADVICGDCYRDSLIKAKELTEVQGGDAA